MLWLARLFLFVPSLVAGWFVSREDPRFWVVAMVIALTFLAMSIIAGLYFPKLRLWPGKR